MSPNSIIRPARVRTIKSVDGCAPIAHGVIRADNRIIMATEYKLTCDF
jgi:hypothetical protein